MKDGFMDTLPDNYHALVLGASGGLGDGFVRHLDSDPRCGKLLALHRGSVPAVDLADESSIARAAEHVRAEAGSLHLVIDATGALSIDGRGPEKRLADIEPEAMAQQFRINAIGPALLLKHFHPLLARRQRAIFATLSARVGSIGDNRKGGWIAHRSAKAALNQVVRTAAIELRRTRPDAICVGLQPGTVATRLSAPWRSADAADVMTPLEASRRLLVVLDGLSTEASGSLYDHNGDCITP